MQEVLRAASFSALATSPAHRHRDNLGHSLVSEACHGCPHVGLRERACAPVSHAEFHMARTVWPAILVWYNKAKGLQQLMETHEAIYNN
jgi:hypothetical protein